MSKLDEIELLADVLANHYDTHAVHTSDAAVDLARTVLAMLPVCRAAIEWQHQSGVAAEKRHQVYVALHSAIDTMRAAIGEKL